jgi:hypothetical protein
MTKLTKEYLDRIFAIAQSRPKHEGITVEALCERGFIDSVMVHAALDELVRQGKLSAGPMFRYTGPDKDEEERN